MTALNRLQLIGNVGAEPKVAMSKQNTEFVTLSLATNERVCRNDEWSTLTEWHNLVFFGKACEVAKKFKKGDQLYVEGKIRSNKWTDSDGVSRMTINVVVQHAHLLARLTDKKEQSCSPGAVAESYLEQMRDCVGEYDCSVPF